MHFGHLRNPPISRIQSVILSNGKLSSCGAYYARVLQSSRQARPLRRSGQRMLSRSLFARLSDWIPYAAVLNDSFVHDVHSQAILIRADAVSERRTAAKG